MMSHNYCDLLVQFIYITGSFYGSKLFDVTTGNITFDVSAWCDISCGME